jgi:opacity protein-like surface antigen
MQKAWNSISWVLGQLFLVAHVAFSQTAATNLISLQNDGSLVVMDAKGAVADFVKQGTPRQSVQIDGQNCNVSYGFNSAGQKTVLLSVPANAPAPVVFNLGENQITIPPKSALRIVLGEGDQIEKMDGNPAETVRFLPLSARPSASPTMDLAAPPTQTSPTLTGKEESVPTVSTPTPLTLADSPEMPDDWPGKLLATPIPASQMEEEMFYARTELGVRFMSSLSLVNISGPQAQIGNYTQKQFAFGTGYRQDFDIGVQLIDWFGLSFTSGFALNSVRGNTEGMTVSDGTFWTFPFMAQLCFQYPNDSGWIPYLNFGFGGAVTVLKLGEVTYVGAPTISGTGNCVTNAYQLAAGVRYRLYEDLSITLAYKFYGNSQGTVNLNNGVQLGLGSPVTNSAEVGVNFAF